jgi:hypothetical protein
MLAGLGAAMALAGASAIAQDTAKDAPALEAHRTQWGQSQGVELYTGTGFSGQSRYFPGAEDNLARRGFNDAANSIRVLGGGAWQLCDDAGFGGRCAYVNGDEPDLSRLGLGNRISSMRPVDDGYGRPGGDWGSGGGGSGGWGSGGWGGGPEIILYDRDGFGGRSVRYRDGISNLASQGFNDAARSLRTRGRWIVCEDADFEGRCRTVEGDLRDLFSIGLANRISSLRPADGHGGGGYDPGYPGYGGGGVDHGGSAAGRTAVFFPRPSLGGQPVFIGREGARRAADDFCRRAGLRESAYSSVERGRRSDVLSDVLCLR